MIAPMALFFSFMVVAMVWLAIALPILIGLGALTVVWVLPIILGVRCARRKGHSPLWMLFGINPVGAWIAYIVLASVPAKTCCLAEQPVAAPHRPSECAAPRPGRSAPVTGMVLSGIVMILVPVFALQASSSLPASVVIAICIAAFVFGGALACACAFAAVRREPCAGQC